MPSIWGIKYKSRRDYLVVETGNERLGRQKLDLVVL